MKVAAAPRPGRGYSVETFRGGLPRGRVAAAPGRSSSDEGRGGAAVTWIFRGGLMKVAAAPGRVDVEISRRRRRFPRGRGGLELLRVLRRRALALLQFLERFDPRQIVALDLPFLFFEFQNGKVPFRDLVLGPALLLLQILDRAPQTEHLGLDEAERVRRES